MSISEAELLAYVDGELDAADRARVEAAIETDELLARRVATQRGLRARLNASYNAVLDEAVPQRLLDVLNARPAASTNVTDIATARAERDAHTADTGAKPPRARTAPWSWRQGSAIAASLVLGVLLGPVVLNQSQSLPLLAERGRVVATGALDAALLWQIAAKPNPHAEVQVGLTFRNKDGRYCRIFSLSQGPTGFACRDTRNWVVEVLARGPSRATNEAALRQAATNIPAVVRQAIEASIDGEPFDAEGEWDGMKKRWRPAPARLPGVAP
jgi:hypothetical protein